MVSIAKIMDTSFDISDHNLYDLLKDVGYEFPVDDDPEDDIDYVYEVEEVDDDFEAEGPSTSEKFTLRFKGKDGYIWSKKPKDRRGRAAPLKQSLYIPASRGQARNLKSLLELWKLRIDQSIMDTIVKHTNEEIKRRKLIREENKIMNETTLYTLFGLQYILGVQKAS